MSEEYRIGPCFYDDHVGYDSANKVHYFLNPDSRKDFLINLAKQGSSWHYRNSANKLSYIFDEYGFRNNHSISEISKNPYIAVVGCSHTMGLGKFYEETYSHQLESIIGIPSVNLGLSGSSNLISLYNIIWLLSNFNAPKILVFQRIGMDRFPIQNKYRDVLFAGTWASEWGKEYRDLDNLIELSDRFGYNKIKEKIIESSVKQLCNRVGTKLILFDPETEFVNGATRDFARDLRHNGPKTDRYFAEILANKIND